MFIFSIKKISTFYNLWLVKVMKNENALVAEKLDGILLKLEKFLRLKAQHWQDRIDASYFKSAVISKWDWITLFRCEKIPKLKYKVSYKCKNFRNDISTQSKMEPHFEKGGGFIKMNMLKSKMKDKILRKVGKPSLINVRES